MKQNMLRFAFLFIHIHCYANTFILYVDSSEVYVYDLKFHLYIYISYYYSSNITEAIPDNKGLLFTMCRFHFESVTGLLSEQIRPSISNGASFVLVI